MNYNQCWLNYNAIESNVNKELLSNITINLKDNKRNESIISRNAVKELTNALKGILDLTVKVQEVEIEDQIAKVEKGIVLCYSDCQAVKGFVAVRELQEEGYIIKQTDNKIYIIGRTENGLLYGAFDLIRRIATSETILGLDIIENPENNLRMLNHWDNMDGSIERGYAGESFFFKNKEILVNNRIIDYARIVASIGINCVVINNVNVRGEAASGLITDRYLGKLNEMATIFAGYGIKLFLSANFAAPIEIGGLSTADPLDEGVAKWWMECVNNVYKAIPGFGGFLIKADSEGRPGPFTYERNHADGANVLAKALKPHGGLLTIASRTGETIKLTVPEQPMTILSV